MTTALGADLRERVACIQKMPAIPMVLVPLLRLMGAPADEVDIDEVVRLVSYDNTIAAQCLRVAGSPLFGLATQPRSVSAAVVVLGLRRVESILLTCCMGQAFPPNKSALDPFFFWKHSLGCAMVCRKFSDGLVRFDSEKAYVAGLLHDIGFLVNALLFPKEFAAAVATASREQIPLHEAEMAAMGFTHCESGQALAEHWGLADEIIQVIASHHTVAESAKPRALVALVHLCDLMCRMRNLDYGYYERHKVDLMSDPAWAILLQGHQELGAVDLELFTFEMDDAIAEICELVSLIFGKSAHA